MTHSCARLSRCVVVWLTATALAALALRTLAGDALALRGGTDRAFDEVLVGCCSLALLACAAWGWLVTTVVAVEALAGHRLPPLPGIPGIPGFARRAVLTACGVAVVGALAAPAGAANPGADPVPAVGAALLAGLPLPDRATGRLVPIRAMAAHTVVVAPGDSLWSLARTDLASTGRRAISDPAVQAHARRLHALNRDLIGPDPDLIHPGQRLRMPR